MSSSQRRVSSKLHNELQSYSSLLRSLRVQDIMDVTKQLKQKNPFALTAQDMHAKAEDDEEELNSADDDDEVLANVQAPRKLTPLSETPQFLDEPIAGPSCSPIPLAQDSGKTTGKQRSNEPTPRPQRDNWTRWPLLPNDILKPEWSLDDEVGFIVSQILKARPPRPDFPVPAVHTDGTHETGDLRSFAPGSLEFDPEDPDHPFYVPYITSVVAEYLSSLLGLLASHLPARAAGMQNRIEPLNWRAVIDVVVSCGVPEFSNTQIVSNVIERMETIYGPSILPIEGRKATGRRPVERMKGKEKAQETFTKTFTEEISKYWHPEPLGPKKAPKPQLAPRKVARFQRHDEREFKPRTKSKSAAVAAMKTKIKDAAKAASKRKKASKKKREKKTQDVDLEMDPPAPEPAQPPTTQPLPTPPETQSQSSNPTEPDTSARRSTRARRSTNYSLRSFLPPIA